MLTGWAGGQGRRGGVTSRRNTISAVADTDADAAPAAAGEGCAGFSLPELLAALAAYSVLLTVALHLFPHCTVVPKE